MAKTTLRCKTCNSILNRPRDRKATKIVCSNCGAVRKRKVKSKSSSDSGASKDTGNRFLLISVGGGILFVLIAVVSLSLFLRSGKEDSQDHQAGPLENELQEKPPKPVPTGAALAFRVEGLNYREWIERYNAAQKGQDKTEQEAARIGLKNVLTEMPEDLSVLDELFRLRMGDYDELKHVKSYSGLFVKRLLKSHPVEVVSRVNDEPVTFENYGHCFEILKLAGPEAEHAQDYMNRFVDKFPDKQQLAMSLMEEIGPGAIPFFVSHLDDDRLASNAMRFLARLKTDGKSAAPAILSNWESYSESSQHTAINTLSKIDPGNQHAVEVTARYCTTSGPLLGTCIEALLHHEEVGITALQKLCGEIKILKSSLGAIKSASKKDPMPKAWPIVKLGLEDEDPEINIDACLAASHLSTQFEEIIPQLTRLTESESPVVAATANSVLFENIDIESLGVDVLVKSLLRHIEYAEVVERIFKELRRRGDDLKPFLPQISETANQIQIAAEKEIDEDKEWFNVWFKNRDGFPRLERVRRSGGGQMRVPSELKTKNAINGFAFDRVEEIESKFAKARIQGVERLKKFIAEFQ